MKKVIISALFLISTLYQYSRAQQKNPLLNSGQVLQSAYVIQDSGWFNLAADTLLTVTESDTGYVEVLAELAYTYFKAKKDSEAVQTADKAFTYPSSLKHRLTLIKGNALDSWGYPDSSIAFYNESLKKYPYSYLIYYNLGVTYANEKKYDLAIKAYQKAILLNPFYASSHLGLGSLMVRMGQYMHAMLSLETYLIIEPNSNRSNVNLVFLNKFVDKALGNDIVAIDPIIDNHIFEETDKLIDAGIANSSGYKTNIKFDAPIVKQTQLLFESIDYKQNTGDFWMDNYIPLFKAIKQNNYFEDFVYTILSSVPNKTIESQLKKRKKSLQSMFDLLSNNLSNIHNKQKVTENGKELVVDFYLDKNNNVLSFGNYTDDGKTRTGYWKFFYPNCELKAEGSYNNQGKLEGKWLNYNNDGTLSYIENYVNGDLEGDYIGYYPSGNVKYKTLYTKNEVNTAVTYYYDCDAVSSIVHFEKDKKNGISKLYFKNGTLKQEYSYVNDSLEGQDKAYYADGTIKWLYNYTNNKINGKVIDYYNNGNIKYEREYVNAIKNGIYKSYHYSGKPATVGEYKNDKQFGEWKDYNENGLLTELYTYNEKGELIGDNNGWDNDGKLHFKFVFQNGKLKESDFYDKNGTKLISNKITSKTVPIKGYFPDGNLKFTGSYTNGNMDGTWTYYYKSGKVNYIKNYKNSDLDGKYISYYATGVKNEEYVYNEGEINSYYKKYFSNGVIETEGWYVNGNQEGKWIYYQPDGVINRTLYFLNNESNGIESIFAPDEKIQFKSRYSMGTLKSIIEYDSKGNEITNNELDGKANYTLHYSNKKIRVNGNFQCNELNSKFIFFDRNGKTDTEYNYLNGYKYGKSAGYYPNGKLKREGQYIEGSLSGLWKYYNKDGSLLKTGYFKNNEKDSIWIGYYNNGKVKFQVKYKNDEPIDTAKYFDISGEFMYSIVYDDLGLVSYQYLTGNEIISKPINPKDTGKIITYYKNGKISSEQTYKFSTLDGKQIFYYNNGNKYKEYSLINNILSETYTEFFENGKTKSIENYLLGLNHGMSQYFRPNGNLEHTQEFRHDDEHGTAIYYNEQGKKINEHRYWGNIQLD